MIEPLENYLAMFDEEFGKLKVAFLEIAQNRTADDADRHIAIDLLERLESDLAQIASDTYQEKIASAVPPDQLTNRIDLNTIMHDELRKLKPLPEVKIVQHVHILQRPEKTVAEPVSEKFFG